MTENFVLPIVLAIILLGIHAASMIHMCKYIRKTEEAIDLIGFIAFAKNKELFDEDTEDNTFTS